MITLHTDKGLVQVNPSTIRAVVAHTDGAKIFFSESHILIVNDTPYAIKSLIELWEDNNV
jgi:hypothetical protein